MTVAAIPPSATVAPPAKPVPVIVTSVPPAADPDSGAIAATTGGGGGGGGGSTVKGTQLVWVSGRVAQMLTEPAACAGIVAMIVVALSTITGVAATPSIVTVVPTAKPVPVIVTAVPGGPRVGVTAVIDNTGATPTTTKLSYRDVGSKVAFQSNPCRVAPWLNESTACSSLTRSQKPSRSVPVVWISSRCVLPGTNGAG